MKLTLAALFLLTASIAAQGETSNPSDETGTTKLSTFELFAQQKATILEDINSDTVYREISHSDANIVRDALDRMSESLSGVNDLSEMTEDQRALLFTDQDLVNTILTMAENDSRMICRRRGTLGTNFKSTTCETVAGRRERQEADRLAIDRLQQGRKLINN